MKKGQVTIESTLGLIIVFIIIGAVIRLFVWFSQSMINRQWAFDTTRLTRYANFNDPDGWREKTVKTWGMPPNDHQHVKVWEGSIFRNIETDYYQPKKLNLLVDAVSYGNE